MKFKIKQLVKMLMQHIILPLVYNINRLKKIKADRVIFADAHHTSCPESMLRVRDELRQNRYDVCEIYFDVNKLGSWEAFLKMVGFMKLYAQSKTVIICDYFLPVVACNKRKDTRVIQLWHGAGAFKKFGYDAALDIPTGYKGYMFKNYDLVTVSGDACVPHFASAMRLEKNSGARIAPIGMSVTDRFFDRTFIEACRASFRYEYPDACGKRVVLWAPTFRGNAGEARLCGEEYIDELIGQYNNKSDIYIIKSAHPHIKGSSTLMSTGELMVCADVLITDYSSVFFDFLLLDRPIIFFAPDYEKYSAERGFYLDYKSLPGYVITGEASTNELKRCMEESILDDVKKELRDTFRDSYMNGCDGEATERIVEYVKGNMAV